MDTTRRRTLRAAWTGAAAAVALGALAAPSGAATLNGSCSTSGPFSFAPTVGPVQLKPIASTYRGAGQCSGVLDGRATTGKGVSATVEFSTTGYGGCGTAAYYAKAPLTITLAPASGRPTVLHATLEGMGYTGVVYTAGLLHGRGGGDALATGRIGGGLEGPTACVQYQLASSELNLQITTVPGRPLVG